MKRLLLTLCAVVSLLVASAQVHVDAKIDSVAMLIGQQTKLTLTVTAAGKAKVEFPDLRPSQLIVPGVEVVDTLEATTTDTEDGMKQVAKAFVLTSFDEHLYAIPSMKVKVDGKEYKTNALALKVITMDVDTLHADQFFPPKDVQDNPFDWNEWKPLLWLSLLMLLLCLVCVYLFSRLKQNKPIVSRIRIVKRVPPHQKALKAIDALRGEQVNSTEEAKTYYTRLTDALRQYIKERFGFNAMEMTSTEILYNLQASGDQKMIDELKELFFTADLVKFAKYSTLLNENDLNLVNAINFIDQTKQEGQPTEERIEPKLTEDEYKTRKNRILLKTLIALSAIAATVLLVWIACHVWLLIQ